MGRCMNLYGSAPFAYCWFWVNGDVSHAGTRLPGCHYPATLFVALPIYLVRHASYY